MPAYNKDFSENKAMYIAIKLKRVESNSDLFTTTAVKVKFERHTTIKSVSNFEIFMALTDDYSLVHTTWRHVSDINLPIFRRHILPPSSTYKKYVNVYTLDGVTSKFMAILIQIIAEEY
jgi:hypothetical protein